MEEKLRFEVDGEWFTDFIRDLYYQRDESYEVCKRKLLDSLHLISLTKDEEDNLAESILFGDKKLVGVNAFDLVDDIEFDVYKYSRFPRPIFKFDCGIRGILTKEGIFVECAYMGHSALTKHIGVEKCNNSISFWTGLMGDGATIDNYKNEITKYQTKWYLEHKQYLNQEQIRDWELLISDIDC